MPKSAPGSPLGQLASHPASGGTSRRGFLRSAMLASAAFAPGLGPLLLRGQSAFSRPAGTFLGLVHFEDEHVAPGNVPLGQELDRRLFTDLSSISSAQAVTAPADYYIRTGASALLPAADGWRIQLDGASPATAAALAHRARPMGTHLMECVGNVRLTRFGLISVGSWTGVPIGDILGELKSLSGSPWVQVDGFDDYQSESSSSIPGASWIFRADELRASGAFLATALDGRPLTRDHGAPVRLIVPGLYGCSCIKWVNRIATVPDGAETTSQMKEYAGRTLQFGTPATVNDYASPIVEAAAMPIRVEQWRVAGKIEYRILGLAWGGTSPIRDLRIRFSLNEDYVPVDSFHQTFTDPWTLWSHRWRPAAPGPYAIGLSIADPGVRARRMGLGLYVRAIQINEAG